MLKGLCEDPHNCLLFVICMWFEHRGYVLIRKSHYGWWPHFLWSKGLKIFEEYTPIEPNSGLLIPPLFYRGWVRKTNAAGQQETKRNEPIG